MPFFPRVCGGMKGVTHCVLYEGIFYTEREKNISFTPSIGERGKEERRGMIQCISRLNRPRMSL